MSNPIERRGRIVASRAAHVYLSLTMPRVYAIPSFDDRHSPSTQRQMGIALATCGAGYRATQHFAGYIAGERTYDAIVWCDDAEREAAETFLAAEQG